MGPCQGFTDILALRKPHICTTCCKASACKKGELEVCCISFPSESQGIKASTAGATQVPVAGAEITEIPLKPLP